MAFYGQCLVMAAWTNHSSGIFLNCDWLFDPTGTLKEEDTKLVQAASVKAKLAILFTDFFLFLLVQAADHFFTDLFLLLYVLFAHFCLLNFFLLFAASVRSRKPGPTLVPGVFLLLSFSLTISILTFCLPSYFGTNRNIKIIFKNLYFCTKKADFRPFFYFLRLMPYTVVI